MPGWLRTFTPGAWCALVVALVLLVAGWVLAYSSLLVIGVGLGLCLLVAGLGLLSRPQLEVDREVEPDRVTVGEPATATIVYRNVGRRRSSLLVAREQFADQQIELALEPLPAGGAGTCRYDLPTSRRGRFQVGPLDVGSSDLFGLLEATSTRGLSVDLVVHPAVLPIDPLPSGRSRDLDGAAGGEALSGGIAFHSLREYVHGDDLRLIHWRASAKAGTLLVRHNVDTVTPRTVV
jgi:uncharacterized protein (DUF58 family)